MALNVNKFKSALFIFSVVFVAHPAQKGELISLKYKFQDL